MIYFKGLIMKKIYLSLIIILSTYTLAFEPIYEWKSSNRHSFCKNFKAGYEADGKLLFISQIERHHQFIGISIAFDENGNTNGPTPNIFKDGGSSWHIGKAGTHLKNGMSYSYGGKEYNVGYFRMPSGNNYSHFTLCLTKKGKKIYKEGRIKWVRASNGNIPSGAVKGINKKENQYVCRISWKGGVHPGKLINNACFIGYGGYEKSSQSYEVLVIN